MARKKKNERNDAPPSVGHDELIDQIEALNRSDDARAMIAAEDREGVQEFLEATNLNPKAFSWCRSILKQNDKDQAKAMDVIRSLEVALPMVKAHVSGQQGDLFTEPMGSEADDEPLDPVSDVVPDDLRAPSYGADAAFNDDQDRFDSHLAAVV